MRPTSRKPGRRAISRPSAIAAAASPSGDRRTPRWPRTGRSMLMSRSIATRMRRPHGGRHDGVDQVELRDRVDHQRDALGGALVRGERRDAAPVGGRVAEHDVVHGRGEPQRLAEGVGEHPGPAGQREDGLDRLPHAQRLRGEPDRRPRGAAEEVVGVPGQRVELEHAERRVEAGRRVEHARPEGAGIASTARPLAGRGRSRDAPDSSDGEGAEGGQHGGTDEEGGEARRRPRSGRRRRAARTPAARRARRS